MTLGEKLSKLRRENNITQEQFADMLGVSRQAISKWEGDLAFPETEKLIRISNLFRCSLDYLLKEETEGQEALPDIMPVGESEPSRRRVSLEDARRFLEIRRRAAWPIAIGTFLCILSPVCLLFLGALSEIPEYGVSENAAGGIGMLILLILVAAAVAIFICSGKDSGEFEYLEKEEFAAAPGVCELVRERREAYRTVYTRVNVVGTCLCVLSLTPLFFGVIFNEDDELLLVGMLCCLLLMVGIGVLLLTRVGVVWASFEKLLQEGDYSRTNKARSPIVSAVAVIYWLAVVALYLLYSFQTDSWRESWIVWAVAGVLYPAVLTVCKLCFRRREQ